MISVRTAHTAQLEPAALAEARSLLYAVFDDMTEDDWEHSLGGIHALAYEGGELAGHAALNQRRLLYGGRALRAGYVEGLGVRPEYRRRGHASAMMDALERGIRDAYDLGALGASDAAVGFYEHRGWLKWMGHTSALTPAGVVGTPEEDDSIFVWQAGKPIDVTGELTCDWRGGDVW